MKGTLSKCQSGFKPGHSIETSLLNATKSWIMNIDNGLYNLTLFLDLRKAFDTVNHEILLRKLESYGIKDTENAWFKSYLSNHLQYCSTDGKTLDYKINLARINQRSSLGPLLFSIYVNDLPRALETSEIILYADDSNLTNAD